MPDNLFAPKPLRKDSPLGKLLIALELPECRCKGVACLEGLEDYPTECPGRALCKHCPREKCKHVEEMERRYAANGGEGRTQAEWLELLNDWADLLAAYDPEGYGGPPPPTEPITAVSRSRRAILLEKRGAAGTGLRHPLDVKKLEDAHDSVGIRAVSGKKQGEITSRKEDEQEVKDRTPMELELNLERIVPLVDRAAVMSLEFDHCVARAIKANRARKERERAIARGEKKGAEKK